MKKALIVASVYIFVHHFERNDIKILKDLGYEVTIASNFNNYKGELDDLDINLFNITFQRNPFSIDNLKAYKNLTKFLKKEKIDLIHCHTPIGGCIGRVAAYRNKVKTIIYTAHGFHFFKGSSLVSWLLYYTVEKYLSKYTDMLITINKEDYKISQNFFAKRIKYIPGVGVDTEKIKNIKIDKNKKRTQLGFKDTDIILLSVGELNKNKNHILVLKALSKIKNKNVIYVIAGTGPLQGYLKKECKNLRIEDRVFFLGYRNDVYELYKSADVFIFPSKREGLGLAPLEAMAAGLPLITSNIRGLRDYIIDGKTGFCIDKFNSDDFKIAIEKIIEDKYLKKVMGSYNQCAVRKFSLKVTDKIMRNLYNIYSAKEKLK